MKLENYILVLNLCYNVVTQTVSYSLSILFAIDFFFWYYGLRSIVNGQNANYFSLDCGTIAWIPFGGSAMQKAIDQRI